MIVCHCRAVSDSKVRRSVADGATDVEAVATTCGAGRSCGGCRAALAALLAELVPAPASLVG